MGEWKVGNVGQVIKSPYNHLGYLFVTDTNGVSGSASACTISSSTSHADISSTLYEKVLVLNIQVKVAKLVTDDILLLEK